MNGETPGARIVKRFERLSEEGRAALVTFVMAGDPDLQTSLDIVSALPKAGADVIEIGMPFSDPMADGPAIQASGLRALKGHQTMVKTLELVERFRETDRDTPIVLMGYYNPIYSYGNERFLSDAAAVGVDGLIIVDVPPEADDELCLPALAEGIAFIRLATPTTDDARLPHVLKNSAGFVYYVSVAGITGSGALDPAAVATSVRRIKAKTGLPICVGFGVKTPEQAKAVAESADGVVVGSALVEAVRTSLDGEGHATGNTVSAVADLVAALAKGVREAAKEPARTA